MPTCTYIAILLSPSSYIVRALANDRLQELHGVRVNGMGLDGMDGMGWDGMGWDGMGWDHPDFIHLIAS